MKKATQIEGTEKFKIAKHLSEVSTDLFHHHIKELDNLYAKWTEDLSINNESDEICHDDEALAEIHLHNIFYLNFPFNTNIIKCNGL